MRTPSPSIGVYLSVPFATQQLLRLYSEEIPTYTSVTYANSVEIFVDSKTSGVVFVAMQSQLATL